MKYQRFFIVGGAGFIGSHIVDYLLKKPQIQKVTIYDSFASGREWHYSHHVSDQRLTVVRGDVKDYHLLRKSMEGHDVVIHLASNPDIARAAREPDIDFQEGTILTRNVLEAMRCSDPKRILYTSGSGVYGDRGEEVASEDMGRLIPISTYAASKLAGEALIASYCYMFDLNACVFRFGNVVGPRQTHGVGYDFVRRLFEDPTSLKILGDGTQSKSYVHVGDVINAVFMAHEKTTIPYQIYNVATGDYITVKEIADLAVECAGLDPKSVRLHFGGGKVGWRGDVPVVRLSIERIESLGWKCSRGCREALKDSILSMISDVRDGKF